MHFVHFKKLALPVFIVLRRPLWSLWGKLQLQQMAWTPWISRSADGEAGQWYFAREILIRILLSLFFFCHDLWRCVSVPINFQATFGSSQALRQLPGLNSAGKRSASSLSICAADVLINISCCLLDLSTELHNSRSGPSTLSLPRCTEVKRLHLKTSSSIQMFGFGLLPCFCRRRWPCWGCRPCVNSWKNWKNNANSVGRKWRWTWDLDAVRC